MYEVCQEQDMNKSDLFQKVLCKFQISICFQYKMNIWIYFIHRNKETTTDIELHFCCYF